MVENHQKRAVGILYKRETAEQALNELKASGFSMDKVSIIAKDAEQGDRIGGAEMSDRIGNKDVQTPTGVVADTLTGATWGSILIGFGSLAIPGIGPIIAAGSVGAALVAGVAGTGIGAAATGALVKALTALGMPISVSALTKAPVAAALGMPISVSALTKAAATGALVKALTDIGIPKAEAGV